MTNLLTPDHTREQDNPFVDKLWRRAQHYIEANQIMAARITLESLLQRVPNQIPARMLLASTILSEGRVREAAVHTICAVQHMPDNVDAICTAAHCLNRLGETLAARELMRHPAIARTTNGKALLELAHMEQELGGHPAALALMDLAKAAGYDSPDFRYYRGLQLQFNGRLREAEAELKTCLRLDAGYGRAALALARLGRQTGASNHLEHIRAHIHEAQQGSENHAAFEFAQYKELEDLSCYEDAFAALERGNTIMHARLQQHESQEEAVVDALISLCSRTFVNRRGDVEQGPTPIFIVGMPRSGTTLLDRILGNHSMVISAGEREDFGRQLRWTADLDGSRMLDLPLLERTEGLDYGLLGRRYLLQTQWRANAKPFYIDKLPFNYLMAGFIQRALPHAPILHMVRDPMDVCFSNYRALFGEAFAYSYSLKALAGYHRNYQRLMRHWHEVMPGRILDVRYVDLIGDTETTIRRIFDHCGLPYEAGCDDLSRNNAAVATLSSAQVRGHIHDRSRGEWKRYAKQLEPLRKALDG